MKNKKMVATLASLCLIVVAVVAAVVGVLAAVTQTAQGSFTIKYIAKNVYATVTVRSAGPTAVMTGDPATQTGRTFHDFEGNSGNDTQSFKPSDTSTTKTVAAKQYEYGWDDMNGGDGADFLGYSVYEFKFVNNGSSQMTVTLSTATGIGTNLTAQYYTLTGNKPLDFTGSASSDEIAAHIIGATYNDEIAWGNDGTLGTMAITTKTAADDESEEQGFSSSAFDDTANVLALTLGTANEAARTGYVYVLVALSNANTSLGEYSAFTQDSNITFVLEALAPTA